MEIAGKSFRPLDGESISKLLRELVKLEMLRVSFRPLDGESISKPNFSSYLVNVSYSFRPLDGESISKLGIGFKNSR